MERDSEQGEEQADLAAFKAAQVTLFAVYLWLYSVLGALYVVVSRVHVL